MIKSTKIDIAQLDNRKISVFYQVIGFLFFGALTFIAWRFYVEREAFVDQSYSDIRLLVTGNPTTVDLGRYGEIIRMILPWLALKMGLSLSTILICQSAGVILLHYMVFLFITIKLKNNGAGLALMLASCIAYSRFFYAPMVEVHESIVLGVLLWAFVHPEIPFENARQKMKATIGALVTVLLLTFFHPLSIFLTFFILGIELTAFKRYRDSQLWILVLMSILLFFLKFEVFFSNNYDQDKIVSVSTIIHELPGIKNWPMTEYWGSLITNHFEGLKWLFIISVLFTIRKGILFFLFTIGYIAGFTLVLLGTFYKGASSLFVYEAYFSIFGFFVGVLFICVFYNSSRKTLLMLISLPFLWVGIIRIYHAHEEFTYRASYLSRIIHAAKKAGGKKCIIDSRCYPYIYADTPWSVAYETLLYSSLSGPDSSVTIFINDPSCNSVCMTNRNNFNIFLGAYFWPLQFTSNNMPSKYFHLPSGGYKDLTTSQDDTSFHEELFSSKNIKIIPLEQVVSVNENDYISVLPLKIENKSGKVLPAIPRKKNPVEVSYTLYDCNGNTISKGSPCTLETDIKDGTDCGLIVYLPNEKGTYFVLPDIVTVDKKRWNVSSSLIAVVIN